MKFVGHTFHVALFLSKYQLIQSCKVLVCKLDRTCLEQGSYFSCRTFLSNISINVQLGQICATLCNFGRICATLSDFGRIFATFGNSEQICTTLCNFEQICAPLRNFGQICATLCDYEQTRCTARQLPNQYLLIVSLVFWKIMIAQQQYTFCKMA